MTLQLYEHDLSSIPIGWARQGDDFSMDQYVVRKQSGTFLFSREMVEDLGMLTPDGLLFRPTPRWRDAERAAIHNAAPHRRITRAVCRRLRGARIALARRIAPDGWYDE